MGLITLVDQLKRDGRKHMLMLEMLKTQTNPFANPQDYMGQFILTYQLDPETELGTPIMADDLNSHVGNYLKKVGIEEYDRKTVFGQFKHWGIKAKRVRHGGKDTKFYLVNPLHKLDADYED